MVLATMRTRDFIRVCEKLGADVRRNDGRIIITKGATRVVIHGVNKEVGRGTIQDARQKFGWRDIPQAEFYGWAK